MKTFFSIAFLICEIFSKTLSALRFLVRALSINLPGDDAHDLDSVGCFCCFMARPTTVLCAATQWATSVCEPHLDQVRCGRRLRMDNASLEKKSSAAALFVFAAPDITQLPLTTVLQWIPCGVRHKQMGYISYKFSVLEVALSIWNFSSYPKRNCFIRTLKDFSQDILPKEEFLYKNSPRFLTGHLSSVAHPIPVIPLTYFIAIARSVHSFVVALTMKLLKRKLDNEPQPERKHVISFKEKYKNKN